MNLTTYSLSAIRTPIATYLDSFYTYKQSTYVYEQGFNINQIAALENVYDSSINNYTTHFLTGYKKLDDFIIPNKKNSPLRTITTPLILNNLQEESIPKVVNLVSQIDNSTYITILSTVDFSNNGCFYELEIFNSKYLRILHNTGDGYYTLNAINTSVVEFTTESTLQTCDNITESSDVFRYQLDENGYLTLFKYINNTLYIVGISNNTLTLFDVFDNQYGRTNTLFKIYYNFESIEPKLRTSWVSYKKTKLNTLSINNNKSEFDAAQQYLLHTNYNEINDTFDLNYVTLNSNKSEKGFIKRGVSTVTGSYNTPDTQFREYTTLRTGNDQERGDDHISLSYIWYDKDIQVYNGKDTYFITPSSIYPYEKLNINDTKFTHNGSLASTIPLLADKVYCLRNKSQHFQNGRYLCTWLSGGISESKGIWVDRYYYPDRVSKAQALSTITVYEPSFFDNIDSLSYPSKATDSFIFDKASDLVIEPNTKYYYSRIGQQDVANILDNLTPVVSGFNSYTILNNNIPYNSMSINYDGTRYSKYNIKSTINCTTQFTMSFEFYVDPLVSSGYSFANSNREFSILNDVKVTPLLTLFQDNVVYIYNSDFNVIKTVSFDTNVKEVILDNPLEDFYVVCNGGDLYKINSVGNKLKREFIGSEIVTYRNFTQDTTYLYFLLNTTGSVLRVDKNNFSTKRIKASPLELYKADTLQSIQRSLVIYNGILYGIPGETVKLKTSKEIYYLINNKEIWYYNFYTNRGKIIFDTRSTINDFEITNDDQILFLTDHNWYKYTLNRVFVLSGTTTTSELQYKNIHVDTIREYRDTGIRETSCILMLLSATNTNTGNLYAKNITTNETVSLGISGRYIPDISSVRRKYNISNFNRLKILEDNTLQFNITLSNYLSSEDILHKDIKVSLKDIDKGYHVFTYRFDALQGNISLYIDGTLYQNVVIPPGKYSIQQIFKESLYIGSVGISNGVDLATFLSQPGFYYINNNKEVKNLYIFDKALKTSEIIALNLKDKPINDLILTLPYSQRNNMEEIERYFKYSPVTSSKSINIYVKNTGITNESLRNNIKTSILEQATSVLPVGVKINDIKFIDFNDTI